MVAGSNAALTAENPGLEKVLLGIGWDMVPAVARKPSWCPW